MGMKKAVVMIFVLGTIAVLATLVAVIVGQVHAEPAAADVATPKDAGSMGWAMLGAAISTGLGCVGAGYAVSGVGAAAVGAVAERPAFVGRALIFVGLAEGIAIYGLIVAIMILGKV